MRAPSKGEFILTLPFHGGLEMKNLYKRHNLSGLSAHHWKEWGDWVICYLGLHPDGAWR